MSERSESPSTVGKLLSKTRSRNRKNGDSATNSVHSDKNEGHGLRASIDNTIDKLKGHTGSDDEGKAGIKKLVPKVLVPKRKRRQQEEEMRASEEAAAEAARGRSVAERGTLRNNSNTPSNGSNDASSLLTYEESDGESPLDTRPGLSTHASHIGYLTSSSPLLQTSIVPEITHTNTLDGAVSDVQPSPRTNEVAPSDSAVSLLADNQLRAPSDSSQRRSPSPVGRLKEAFKPRRGGSPNSSPERKVGGSGPGAASRENLGNNSRRGSVVSRIFDKSGPQSNSASSSPERPRNSKPQPIDTHATPQTPPPSDLSRAPTIVNTPPTPTETGEGRAGAGRDRVNSDPAAQNTNVVTSPSGNMISHRRVRSNSAALGPSKLSNITSAPLTPTPENGSTTPSAGGFFSSVFSAAQNAANTLSSSIANTSVAPNNRNKSNTAQELKEIVESPEVESLADKTNSESSAGEKELAVKTLGMGDLNLSHLGISETQSNTSTPMALRFPEDGRSRASTNESPFSNPDISSTTLTGAEGFDTAPASVVDDTPVPAPRSNYEHSAGEQTPPNGSLFEGKGGIHRSGSIRSSKFGHRRKRGSSAATGGSTIGAALLASHSALSSPNNGTPKITGFAVASKKRNRDFHNLFKSVPEDDYLIEDYSCALQREILAHGRLYVSEGHLCFSSNIFGWVTTLVMSFDEIVSVEKRSTALLFKNGLMISTLHAKNIFASFTSRDSTYDLIVGIWKLGHPSLRSSLNGVAIPETGGGDKTEKYDGTPAAAGSQSGSESDSEGEDGDEMYDEDEEDEDGMSFTQADGSVAGSDVGERVVSRKPSAPIVSNGTTSVEKKEDTPATAGGDFPGPASHAPTKCGDADTHFPRVLADEIIAAPLGKVYSMLFGPQSSTWYKNFLLVDQKCFDLVQEGSSALPLTLENKVRNYSYIKPLSGAIGPKQTKCISIETLDSLDLEKAVSVTIGTQNPDVPSGNVFSVKTRYCLMWAENNSTRFLVTCVIEWTGKSWLKGPIEKGTNDGQAAYAKDLVAALKAAVSKGRPTAAVAGRGKKKGRKGRESKGINKTTDGASDPKPAVSNWGLFEPLHGILGPVADIFGPLFTGNMVYGLLVGLLVTAWFGFGFPSRNSSRGSGMGFITTPERVAAYEEMWRREESELWEWLEDRVGTAGLRNAANMPIEAKNIKDKLGGEKMEAWKVDAAIRVTEEKLNVLKDSVAKKKEEMKADQS